MFWTICQESKDDPVDSDVSRIWFQKFWSSMNYTGSNEVSFAIQAEEDEEDSTDDADDSDTESKTEAGEESSETKEEDAHVGFLPA